MENPTTPKCYINEFPAELLSRIFEEAITTYPKAISPDSMGHPFIRDVNTFSSPAASVVLPRTDFPTFSSIARVCTYWRNVSLGTGSLWAVAIEPDFDGVEWAAEVARRARNFPLVIQSGHETGINYNHDFERGAWNYVSENTDQWRVFSLHAEILEYDYEFLSKGFKLPAPQLEFFRLYNRSDFMDDSEPEIYKQYLLPDDLFLGKAPRLKTFVTRNVYFPDKFNFSLWKNLTVLQIMQQSKHPYGKALTTHDWLEILRPITMLEHLELHGTFVEEINDFCSHSDLSLVSDVHFKYLSILTLEATQADTDIVIMFELLVKLIIPNTCRVSITVLGINGFDSLPNRYWPWAFDSLKLCLDRHVQGLFAVHGHDTRLQVDLGNSLNGTSFMLEIRVVGKPTSNVLPNFRFNQILVPYRHPGARHPKSKLDPLNNPSEMARLILPNTLSLDAIPDAEDVYVYFSELLKIMEDLPASELRVKCWPMIVQEDIDPFFRFLSGCQIDHAVFVHTDPVLLDILQQKVNWIDQTPLLSGLRHFEFTCESEQVQQRLGDFLEWRNSVGQLPENYKTEEWLPKIEHLSI